MWIFKHPAYETWFNSNASSLWLYGSSILFIVYVANHEVGVGKSVLMYRQPEMTMVDFSSSIIEKLSGIQMRHSSLCLAYFYCDGNFPEKQNPQYIFGSIVRQLLITMPPESDPTLVTDLKRLHYRHAQTSYTRRPPLDVILGILERVSACYETISVVIDGVDECEDRHELLTTIQSLRKKNKFKLLVASRPESDILNAFQDFPSQEMVPMEILQDIETHLNNRIYQRDGFKRLSDNFKTEVKTRLLKDNQGM